MADQQLEIICSDIFVDGVTGVAQRKDLSGEEFRDGWLYKQSISAQQFNQMQYLLSLWSNPQSNAPSLFPSASPIPDIALEMNGQAILEVDYPNAFSVYGATLPDITADAPTGFTYIIRKS